MKAINHFQKFLSKVNDGTFPKEHLSFSFARINTVSVSYGDVLELDVTPLVADRFNTSNLANLARRENATKLYLIFAATATDEGDSHIPTFTSALGKDGRFLSIYELKSPEERASESHTQYLQEKKLEIGFMNADGIDTFFLYIAIKKLPMQKIGNFIENPAVFEELDAGFARYLQEVAQ